MTDKLNDHSHNNNSTLPILPFISTSHNVPLRSGFSGQLKLWFIFEVRDTDSAPLHHGGKGTVGTFTWVLGLRTSWKDEQWRSKQKRALLPQKHWKTTLHFKKVERWEIMLFKLGICPIEMFNTEAQKLKYSKPAPIQKSESPWWDYHSRNSMFIGS